MIESKIDEILANLLHHSIEDYQKNCEESLAKIEAISIEKVKHNKKRNTIASTPDIRDYRQMTTLFMAFLFRQFPELQSLRWQTYFEYDDSTGYGICPKKITINERIHIEYGIDFDVPDQQFETILNKTQIDGYHYAADFETHWQSLDTAAMAQMDMHIQKEYGDYQTYFDYLQGCTTKAYLKEHHLEEPIRAVLILLNLLEELAHTRFSYGEDFDLMEQQIPFAVSTTQEGIQFSMRSRLSE